MIKAKFLKQGLLLFLSVIMIITLIPNFSFASNEIDNTQRIYFSNPNVKISSPKTLEELAESLSKKTNISKEEAIRMFKNSVKGSTKKNTINSLKRISEPDSSDTTFREISQTIFVKKDYFVQLVFYCEVNRTGPMRIHRILHYTLNRGYRGGSYGFQGEIYVNLENNRAIYYSISGDFYRNSQAAGEIGGEVGVGEKSKLNLKVSGRLDHFAYLYNSDRIYWGEY